MNRDEVIKKLVHKIIYSNDMLGSWKKFKEKWDGKLPISSLEDAIEETIKLCEDKEYLDKMLNLYDMEKYISMNEHKCKNCKKQMSLQSACFDNNGDHFCSYECRDEGGEWTDEDDAQVNKSEQGVKDE